MIIRTSLKTSLLMAVILLGLCPAVSVAATIYVDVNTPDNNDGSSWAKAYKYLQDGLAVAGASDEIWAAAGTYYPDANTANPGGTGVRTATFQLINSVAIYGGFAGGESSRDERDWQTNETVLSGEIGAAGNSDNSYHVVTGSGTDANAVLDGFTITAGNANVGGTNNYGGGMYNTNSSTPTVTNCTFSGNSADFGGGMYNEGFSSPTVTNCTFSGNSATAPFARGGGMYNEGFSSPTVTNCTFSGNWADIGGGMYNYRSSPTVTNCTFSGNSGSGMGNFNSSPTVVNCTFSANWAIIYGGGMFNWDSNPTVTNCTFSDNRVVNRGSGGGMGNFNWSSPTVTDCNFSGNSVDLGNGGGMYNDFSSPTVTNCTFSGNLAGDVGAGMANVNNSNPTLTNCTFSGNSARYGGGMYNNSSTPTVTNCTFSGNSVWDDGGGMYNNNSDPTLNNCILWGNSAPTGPEIYNLSSTTSVTYSDIAGGYAGWGNIDDDPCFVDPNGADNIIGTEDDNLRLSADSNCIDAGDNTAVPADTADLDGDADTAELTPLDLDGQDRFIDDPNTSDTGVILPASYPENVDMGAYEWYGGPACGDAEHPYPPGDVSGPDGIRDCYIDFYDFAVWAAHWLEYTGPE